jgi:hypothetical protein
LFDAIEEMIRGLIITKNLGEAFNGLIHEHFSKMWLGGLIMVGVSFLPFFTLKELSRVIGDHKFRSLLFKGGSTL